MNQPTTWMETNETYLTQALAWLRRRLEQVARTYDAAQEQAGESAPCTIEAPQMPPALTLLAQRLGLTHFEQRVLLLCAAVDLDTRLPHLCARAQDDPHRPYPTFALAFTLFAESAWNALAPQNPLRYWRLIEIHQPGAQPLISSALRADERIVNYLKGLNYLDDRLLPLVEPLRAGQEEAALPPSQQAKAEAILAYLRASQQQDSVMPIIELLGSDAVSKRTVLQKVADDLGCNIYRLAVHALPIQTADLETFIRLWQRDALLLPLGLYVDGIGEADQARTEIPIALRRLLPRINTLCFLDVFEPLHLAECPTWSVEIAKPAVREQQALWTQALGGQAGDLPPRLAAQFNLNQGDIARLAATALACPQTPQAEFGRGLWEACRVAARPRLEQLARRIDVKATWDELVLPEEELGLLCQIISHVAQRLRVYDDWGFRARMNRGLGISALFAGESGTGKTMAAEVIANALQLDLYRIDLSAVVSKYIGETEKNLRQLFDAAEDSGAILFFDEADALFGKRSEVRDSHDRYANIETNYLLQRMEVYRGLAILATNMRSALDQAFVRRLRFIVNFPFPGPAERQAIWQKIFPPEVPKEDLDFDRLGRLNLTGGSIHNIALNAAFMAAHADASVTMPLLLEAARSEFRKLEKPINEAELRF